TETDSVNGHYRTVVDHFKNRIKSPDSGIKRPLREGARYESEKGCHLWFSPVRPGDPGRRVDVWLGPLPMVRVFSGRGHVGRFGAVVNW
ncbi:hypothetical protein, partial [Streptomyces spororaveus]|uniref:hypothetical protein n=1 Tax=Streptomyces spororaveus TaxID=284039 RepID=UPI0031E13E08